MRETAGGDGARSGAIASSLVTYGAPVKLPYSLLRLLDRLTDWSGRPDDTPRLEGTSWWESRRGIVQRDRPLGSLSTSYRPSVIVTVDLSRKKVTELIERTYPKIIANRGVRTNLASDERTTFAWTDRIAYGCFATRQLTLIFLVMCFRFVIERTRHFAGLGVDRKTRDQYDACFPNKSWNPSSWTNGRK